MVPITLNTSTKATGRPRPPVSSVPIQETITDTFTPTKEKKIWLIHGSHTGGHRSAARALEEALEKHPNVDAEVINLAETSDNSSPLSTAAETTLKAGAWIGGIRRWVFDQQFEGNKLVKWASNKAMAFEGRFQDPFLARVEKEKPDAIISTMSATNSLLSHWVEEGKLEQPVHSVVTDFASHQMWAQENIAFYYVATPQVKSDLEKFGAPKDRVQVSGIPIKGDFATPARSASEAREELGLDPSKPLVLVLGGSLGLGSFGETVSAIDQGEGNFQLAAITGRNEKLQNELACLKTDHPFAVEGFVDNMPTWIEAADIVVTKPGGLTCSEILARGKPMILKRAESGLEKRMVERLGETGASVVVESTEQIGAAVSRLFNGPEELQGLSTRARELGHPDSSARIAESILQSI